MQVLSSSWNGSAPGSSCWSVAFAARDDFEEKKSAPGPNGQGNVQAFIMEPGVCLDLEIAERETIMFDQKNVFPEEIETIQKGGCVKETSWLAKLNPVLIDGILRVGGRLRLRRAPLPDESRLASDNYRQESITCCTAFQVLSREKCSVWRRTRVNPLTRTVLVDSSQHNGKKSSLVLFSV